jgi:integrase
MTLVDTFERILPSRFHRTTLQEAVDRFLKQLTNAETERSYQGVLYRFSAHVGPERPLNSIALDDINSWHRSLKRQDVLYENHPNRERVQGKLSPHTIHKHLRSGRRFWNWCVEVGEVDVSPMKGKKIEQPEKVSVSRRTASLKRLKALIDVMRQKPHDWALFCFYLDTGCRSGAVAELPLARLDMDRRIAHTIGKRDKEHDARFSPITAAALRAWLKVRPKDACKRVFLNRDGNPWNSDSLRSWLYRRCDKAEIKRISPHALRRTLGCHLAMMKVPLSLITSHMGHSRQEITLDHYMPDDDDLLYELLEVVGLLAALGIEMPDDDEDDEDEEDVDEDDDEALTESAR